MLVPEMIDVPRLVGNDKVVVAVLDQFLEHHEIGNQDFVHAAQRLEDLEIVLAAFGLDMAGLIGQQIAGRMNALAGFFQEGGDRVLGQPVDLEVRMKAAQLARDRHVAARMAEADGRGEIEGTLAADRAAPPHHGLAVDVTGRAIDEIADQPVDQHRARARSGYAPSLPMSPAARR